MKLIIRAEDLPSDKDIEEKIVTGILDEYDNEDTFSIVELFKNFAKDRLPASDASLTIPDPGEIPDDLLVPRESTDHDCEDPNCPHKASISPLAAMLAGMISNRKKVDLSAWEPFKYPIVSMSKNVLPLLYPIASHSNANFVRVSVPCTLAPTVDSFMLSRYFCVVEALHFEDETYLPENVTIEINGNPQIKILCDRKYVFLGFQYIQSPWCTTSILFPKREKSINFSLIAWISPSDLLREQDQDVEWNNIRYSVRNMVPRFHV